jgi:hypothetical protein
MVNNLLIKVIVKVVVTNATDYLCADLRGDAMTY